MVDGGVVEGTDKQLKDNERSWPARQPSGCNNGGIYLRREAGKLERCRQGMLAPPNRSSKTWLTGMLEVHGCFKVLGTFMILIPLRSVSIIYKILPIASMSISFIS